MVDYDDAQQKQIRESIEHIADRAATKAVSDVLMLLGIDVTNPIKAQEEMASLRKLSAMMQDERTIANLAWLDRLHNASSIVTDTGWRTTIRILVTAGIGLLALMTKEYWISHIGWK